MTYLYRSNLQSAANLLSLCREHIQSPANIPGINARDTLLHNYAMYAHIYIKLCIQR